MMSWSQEKDTKIVLPETWEDNIRDFPSDRDRLSTRRASRENTSLKEVKTNGLPPQKGILQPSIDTNNELHWLRETPTTY